MHPGYYDKEMILWKTKRASAAYICAQRKALGMTQREFADKLFLTESAVSKWERG